MTTEFRQTIGIFGGSFNPPHIAHVLACMEAISLHEIPRIIVIPAFNHPFAKDLAPYEHRLEMARLAFRPMELRVEISEIERELGGVSYTIDTIQELKRRLPYGDFRLMIGSDIVLEAPKWHRFPEIVALAPPLVLAREGIPNDPFSPMRHNLPEVSSTEIRAALAEGRDVTGAVPPPVLDYIRKHGLYGTAAEQAASGGADSFPARE